MRKIVLLMLIFFQCSCDMPEQAGEKAESKAKATPEVQEMMQAFHAQAHRIELNGCVMLYNGRPFHLGMTVGELKAVFGSYDLFDQGVYSWKASGVMFGAEQDYAESDSAVIKNFAVYMNEDDGSETEGSEENWKIFKDDLVLIQGVPLAKNTPFSQFIGRSMFSLDEFNVSDYSYELHYQCGKAKEKLVYYVGAKGGWVYKGTGHLQMKSHLDADNTNKISSVNIFTMSN